MPLDGGGGGGAPPFGWARTDLASDVQTSLAKADGSLQAAEKGAASGTAGLDAAARVAMTNLPFLVITETAYQALATKDPAIVYLRTAG